MQLLLHFDIGVKEIGSRFFDSRKCYECSERDQKCNASSLAKVRQNIICSKMSSCKLCITIYPVVW